MSQSRMRGHFRYLRFKTFPMTPRTSQCEVFWSSKSSSEFSGVPEDSNPNFFQVFGFTPTLGQSRVATCIVGTLLVLRQTTGNSDTQDSPWPRLGGSHHFPPYSILYASPRGPHLNGFLSRDSEVGVPKFPQLGLPRL